MTEFRYRPLSSWPVDTPRTQHPRRSDFSAGWQKTLDLLDRELWHLGAKDVVIEGGWKNGHVRLDGMLRSDAPAPKDPAIVLSFESKFGPLRYACDTYDRWTDNVRAISLSLEALRSVDRWGISKRGEQYRGWNELPSGIAPEPPMTVEAAADFLVEHADFSDQREMETDEARALLREKLVDHPELYLASVYRRAAKALHPDLGGDPAKFRKLQRAKETIEEASR